jgi:hypothetical protein
MQHYVIHFCQWLAVGWWFCPGTLVSSTNKSDFHNITEILLKVALNIITLTPNYKSQISPHTGLFLTKSLYLIFKVKIYSDCLPQDG